METEGVYILGAGSIGMALAVHLVRAGRHVTALRTSTEDVAPQAVEISVSGSGGRTFTAPVEMVSLAKLRDKRLAGIVAVTAKTYANDAIAARLAAMGIAAPVVIMQNGVGVEDGYLAIDGLHVYRCVLYATAQQAGENRYTFAPVTASQIGVVRGDEEELARTVDVLNTSEFPFTASRNIQRAVWKKAAVNAVFNSVCPLLEVDNGIFVRDERAAGLAREIVDECVAVMDALGLDVGAEEVMQQLFVVSERSSGQLISTLQDIYEGRETEIDHLNLAIARIAERVAPDAKVSTTRALGEMIKIKSSLKRRPR